MRECRYIRLFFAILASAYLAACTSGPPTPSVSPDDARARIDVTLPRGVADRPGWVEDIYAAFSSLQLTPTPENTCAVSAVIAQESGFRVDPPVANLGVIARREIDSRAEHAHVPLVVVNGVLSLKSPTGRTYAERIDGARTEKQLSDIYEDFIGSVPLGETLFADHNPIRTRGPMQVNVVFAREFAAARRYPYPVSRSIPDELFTRRGSLYFGMAHLLDYHAPYDDFLYRFADFNAGQYASRNAAFQAALGSLTGNRLTADGALLPRDDQAPAGDTESAARYLGSQLELSADDIHTQLKLGRQEAFEESALYRRVFARAERSAGHPLPRAIVPTIKLQGPKIQRNLTTAWYADRVNQRFNRCLKPS